jgi:hypothetical protein
MQVYGNSVLGYDARPQGERHFLSPESGHLVATRDISKTITVQFSLHGTLI